MVYDLKAENEAQFRAQGEGGEEAVLTGRQKVILIVFALAFLVMMYGVIPWDDLGVPLPTLWWWFSEMTASFLLFTIVIGLIARMKEGELTSTFVDGARDLLGVALIIGIARGITVIMNNGEITDTVLHWAEVALGDVGKAAFSIVMYVFFLPLSFLIPSSSGLATVSMPIMAPLAGFVEVPERLVVTAYQSANGLMNLFIPTSAVVMGGLTIARVPYGRYLQVGVAAAGDARGARRHRARRRRGTRMSLPGGPVPRPRSSREEKPMRPRTASSTKLLVPSGSPWPWCSRRVIEAATRTSRSPSSNSRSRISKPSSNRRTRPSMRPQQQNADLTTELSDTQDMLAATKKELGTTEAELLDAQAQLATVGELVLADGTYVGRVLGAKASPYRVIVFDAGGLYRVAQVSDDPTITAGNSDYTLTQFGKLLSSTDPDNAKLANGNYRVVVKDGLATSIRKSKK